MKIWITALLLGWALVSAAQASTGVIQGVVTDTNDVPVPSRTVWLSGPDGLLISTTTDAYGFYQFDSLAEGEYAAWLVGGTGTVFPACGVHSGELSSGGLLNWYFAEMPTGGVVIDLGRPVGSAPGSNIPTQGDTFNNNIFQLIMNVGVDDALSFSNVPFMLLEGHWFVPKEAHQERVPIMVTGYQQRGQWIDQLNATFSNNAASGANTINLESSISLGQDGEVAAFSFLVTAPAWSLIEGNDNTVCLCITTVEAEPMTDFINAPFTWCGDLYRNPGDDGSLGHSGDDSRHH